MKVFYFLMVGLSLLAFQTVDVEAQRGDPRVDTRDSRGGDPRVDTRDPRGEHPPLDTRDPRGGDVRDPRAAAPSEDTIGGGLSKREMIQACKKQYGKKKKNKAAKQACIAAAKGR